MKEEAEQQQPLEGANNNKKRGNKQIRFAASVKSSSGWLKDTKRRE